MAKTYYQTTKTVKVLENNKVIVRAAGGVPGPKGDAGTQVLTGPGLPSNLIGQVGDLYVNTNDKKVYGPKTINGWDLTKTLFEGFQRDLLGIVFNVPEQQGYEEIINGVKYWVWHIVHDLGYNPNATCIDTAGTVIEGNISYPDENTIVLRFIGRTAGKAYLS